MTAGTMGELRFGTSSWSHPSWEGPFYPKGTSAGEYLAYYAGHFDTVEVDATYYRIPDPRMVRAWEERTPPGFLLSSKFPRSVVHAGTGPQPDPERLLVLKHVEGEVQRFLEVMSLMGDKAGPLVLQFPYFNRSVFTSHEPFLDRLDAVLATLPDTFRYAVEVRNRAWVAEPLLKVLRRHRVALVLVDLLYMPHPADLARKLDPVTTDFTYARLIGDRKAVEAATKTFDRIVIDQTPRLERWARLLASLAPRLTRTLVYANNHYAGHAPETTRQLAAMTRQATAPTT